MCFGGLLQRWGVGHTYNDFYLRKDGSEGCGCAQGLTRGVWWALSVVTLLTVVVGVVGYHSVG